MCSKVLFFILLFTMQSAFSIDYGTQESTYCKPKSNSIQLNYSQKSLEQNEFLVGWSILSNEKLNNNQKPQLGAEITIVRCLPPNHFVVLGKGTVTNVNGGMVQAHVTSPNLVEMSLGKSSQNWIESRNLIWRPMVGDIVIPIYKHIQKALVVSPTFQFNTNDLFIKREDGTYSFTLSELGQNLLKEKFEKFKNRNGRLLVEGYNLNPGSREEMRLDSLMRAQTVSTFFIREYSLEQSRVVPVGYGNDWLQTGMQPVDTIHNLQSDDGIILKILNE